MRYPRSHPPTRRESQRLQHNSDNCVTLHRNRTWEAEDSLCMPDANDNSIPIANNNTETDDPTASFNNTFFSMRRMRSGLNNNVPGGNGAGESPQLLFSRQGQFNPNGSSLFCGFVSSSLRQRAGRGQRFELDFEHCHYDEALHFVTSKKKVREERSEICAGFVREHFKCLVCLDVLIEPTALACGHRFCKLCLDTWLRIKYTCPVCGAGIRKLFPQYDVDTAIESVADYLSSEWQERRQVSIRLRQSPVPSANLSSSLPTIPSHTEWFHEMKGYFETGHRYVRRNGSRWWNSFCDNAVQIYDSFELNSMVLGVFLGSSGAFLLFVSGDIIDFVQYMYYVISNYDKSSPIMKQIEMFGGEVSKEPLKYRELPGGSNTIYADFISLFYA